MNSYDQMREALEEARRFVFQSSKRADRDLLILDDQGPRILQPQDTLAKMDAALAIPRRNCDVGSAKEQNARYEHYCFTYRTMERCCQDCPIKDEPCCELAWAQLPYEREGEGDGSK